ncbi:MAG: hypothetical protein ACYCYP_11265 [Leptospirales bacterium]
MRRKTRRKWARLRISRPCGSLSRKNLPDAIGVTGFRNDDTNGEDAVFRPEDLCP